MTQCLLSLLLCTVSPPLPEMSVTLLAAAKLYLVSGPLHLVFPLPGAHLTLSPLDLLLLI